MQVITTISGLLTPYAEESLTVTTAVKQLTTSKWKQRGSEATRDMGNARLVIISVEGRVRYWLSGTDPDGSTGHILNDGDVLTLASEQQFTNFKAFRHSGEASDATLRVSYLR